MAVAGGAAVRDQPCPPPSCALREEASASFSSASSLFKSAEGHEMHSAPAMGKQEESRAARAGIGTGHTGQAKKMPLQMGANLGVNFKPLTPAEWAWLKNHSKIQSKSR